MKRSHTLCLLILLVFIMVGCGYKYDLSKSTRNAAKRIVECTDQYINSEITYDEYKDKLDEYRNKIVEDTHADEMINIFATSLSTQSYLIDSSISDYYSLSDKSIEDVIETRNKIAEYVEMKPYE